MKGFSSFSLRLWLPLAAIVLIPVNPARSAETEKNPPDNASAATLVRQALESELAGRNDRRESLLQLAVLKSPDHSSAQWQLGKVRDGEKNAWLTPEQSENAAQHDPRLAEYRKRRDAVGPTLQEHITLAQWCRKNKLENEERVHWLFVLEMQPNYPEAVQRLDLHPYKGMMLTGEQIAERKELLRKQAQALERWRPWAAEWQAALDGGESFPPAEAREKAVGISSPGEMIALQKALMREAGGQKQKLHGLTLSLARTLIDNPHPAAAQCLSHLSLYSPWNDVRESAVEGLKKHPLDHYAPLLMATLRTPIEADILFNVDSNGNLITHSKYYREGALADLSLTDMHTPVAFNQGVVLDESASYRKAKMDAPGDIAAWQKRLTPKEVAWQKAHPAAIADWQKTDKARLASTISANERSLEEKSNTQPIKKAYQAEAIRQRNIMNSQAIASQKADAFYDGVEQTNREIAENNREIIRILKETTGQDLGENPMKWWKWWWEDHNEIFTVKSSGDETPGYDSSPDDSESRKPVQSYYSIHKYSGLSISLGVTRGGQQNDFTTSMPPTHSCFAPGTIVWTQMGRIDIEKIKVGDRVLAQNADTGELAYKPVVGVTVRKPGPRIKVGLGTETITATPSHPFWTNGEGWLMTKQLEVGKRLHSVSGGVPIESIEKVEADPSWAGYSYNLIVADFNSYFVGERGILVHDNTPRSPTSALVPGLPAEAKVAKK